MTQQYQSLFLNFQQLWEHDGHRLLQATRLVHVTSHTIGPFTTKPIGHLIQLADWCVLQPQIVYEGIQFVTDRNLQQKMKHLQCLIKKQNRKYNRNSLIYLDIAQLDLSCYIEVSFIDHCTLSIISCLPQMFDYFEHCKVWG